MQDQNAIFLHFLQKNDFLKLFERKSDKTY